MALASGALAALVPLAMLTSALLGLVGHQDVANPLIRRYGLTGGGAEAVRQLFSSATDATAGEGVLETLFLVISVLSFTRSAQRLFEQTWQLKPLSVRNTPNGLRWVLVLLAYLVVTGWLRVELGRGRLELTVSLCQAPLTAGFFLWSGRLLSAQRIAWRELLPFAVVGAVLTSAYSVGATVYLPHLFDSYTTRYGPVGAVVAMISALFTVMLVVVGSAALGREVGDELGRIRRGQRPPHDEVLREWESLVEQIRSHWRPAREQFSRHHGPEDPKHR
ncbi:MULTISPECIES: YhjD/YihY/BrkB family envelope integrity protein [unclassified Kitasatospora]|uniref:YhjD/YihY/BrkB family envelope integrity protein n=1 Tax=unclassified Kitasatospora TaxID=2633591 RepID=UPI0033D679CF